MSPLNLVNKSGCGRVVIEQSDKPNIYFTASAIHSKPLTR